MSTLSTARRRGSLIDIGTLKPSGFSAGVSASSESMSKMLSAFQRNVSSSSSASHPISFVGAPQERFFLSMAGPKGLRESLFDARSTFKTKTSLVAMHLNIAWRDAIFKQVDSLLDDADWDVDDPPPTVDTIATFLRLILLLQPARRPGLGATGDGNLVAMWTRNNDRLTIECLPRDRVKWTLSCNVNDERETAAGASSVANLPSLLKPYHPQRWFSDAD